MTRRQTTSLLRWSDLAFAAPLDSIENHGDLLARTLALRFAIGYDQHIAKRARAGHGTGAHEVQRQRWDEAAAAHHLGELGTVLVDRPHDCRIAFLDRSAAGNTARPAGLPGDADGFDPPFVTSVAGGAVDAVDLEIRVGG